MSSANSSTNRSGLVTLVALYIASIVVALIVSGVLIALTGGPWQKVLSAFLDGAFRKPGRWGGTLAEMAPMLIVALGAIVSTQGGLVNIGQEGQLAMGAASAAFVGTRVHGPVGIVGMLAAGVVGGAAWAGIAAVLKYRRQVPEVISTLLLVFIASQVTGYLLTRTFLLLDPDKTNGNRTQASAQLTPSTRIGAVRLFGNVIPWSVIVSILLAFGVGVMLRRSAWGLRLSVLGRNQRTAQRIGVSVVATGAIALMIGGAFAGFAGAAMLGAGSANHRLTSGFANSVGWEGLLVALVARNRPLACIPVALVFASLRTGSGFLAATGVERSVVEVVRGLLVVAMLVPPAVMAIRERRARPAGVVESAASVSEAVAVAG